MFRRADLDALTDLLRDAARAEVMPRFRRLAPGAVRRKTSALDLVTEADEAAERMIAAGLARRFPGCLVVGEEDAATNPALLTRLPDAALAFVVDPIDGTANFAAGLPLFGVMAAAIVRGEVAGAVILDPVCDDAALALRGEGAWTEAPGGARQALCVAAPTPAAELAGNVAWRYLPPELRAMVCANLPRLAATWDYRCAAHQYRMTAAGHSHFLFFHRLMPWDHAPGWLLHREAGGYAARFDGSPYLPAHSGGGLICAPDRATWQIVRDTLLPGMP